MDSIDNLKQASSDTWQTVNDLFEDVFADEAGFNKENDTSQPLGNIGSNSNVETTYITLDVPDYAQELNDIDQITNEQSTEEIQNHNASSLTTFHSISDQRSRNPDSAMSHIPRISINTDDPVFQKISPPFDIPNRKILQAGIVSFIYNMSSREIRITIKFSQAPCFSTCFLNN